jgi:Flp pilus assembly protein TadD
MSPGYAEDTHADFSRPVTAECLQCHAGRALPVEGTRNRYQGPPFAAEAISCERCHGPSEAHLAHPSRETIVNPKELPPRARASVCEQCHLAGEARVPNPGHTLADFQPGMKLEDVWSAYVLSRPPGAATDAMKAVSHAESLARSGCAQASGEAMWCGSCHNPHETPANAAAYYRGRCLACHGEELPTTHAEPNRDCIGCHMPKQGAADIAHAAVTDHRIPRDPRSRPAAGDSQSASGASQSAANAGQQLSVWSEPPAAFRRRNFGLALIEVGERYRYDRLMQEGLRVLSGARESFPRDPAVLAAMAKALYGQRKFSEAAALFETAAEIEPRVAEYALHLGSSYRALGETEKATEYFERAIRLDPGREDAYQALAGLYEATKRPEEARRTLSRHELFLDGR